MVASANAAGKFVSPPPQAAGQTCPTAALILDRLLALAAENAALRADCAELSRDLVLRDDALRYAEVEIDLLRHAIGETEVPL